MGNNSDGVSVVRNFLMRTVDEVLRPLPVTALRPKIFVKRFFSAIVFINAWHCTVLVEEMALAEENA